MGTYEAWAVSRFDWSALPTLEPVMQPDPWFHVYGFSFVAALATGLLFYVLLRDSGRLG